MGGGEVAARVLEAISRRVSLIAMHTNLDKSPLATHVLLSSLGLAYEGELTKTDDDAPGFGCLAAPIHEEQPMSLGDLARRYIGPDGRRPRVWGDPEKEVRVVAVANGSSSSMMSDIVLSGADCAITGEMSYHKACELVSEGIGLIELGHDVSELPLLECLRKTVESNPAFAFNVKVLDQGIAWWQPEMEGL